MQGNKSNWKTCESKESGGWYQDQSSSELELDLLS
jgi:hypothetical protein